MLLLLGCADVGRKPTSLAVASEVEVLEDWLLNNKLLCNESCDGDHSQTAVVEFLGLKVVLGLGVGWVQVEGVKAKGAWLVISVQLVEVAGGGGGPADLHAVGLCNGNSQEQGLPEDGALLLHLLEVVDCWACIAQNQRSQT